MSCGGELYEDLYFRGAKANVPPTIFTGGGAIAPLAPRDRRPWRARMHARTGVRTEGAQKMFQLSFDLRFNEAEWSAKIEGESNRSIAQLKFGHLSMIIVIAEPLAVD